MKNNIEIKKNKILVEETIKTIKKIENKEDLKRIYNYIKRLESK